MIPNINLIIGLTFIVGLSIVILILPHLLLIWYGVVVIFIITILLDLLLSLRLQPLQVKRQINATMSINSLYGIQLQLHNPNKRGIKISVFDHPPSPCEYTRLPLQTTINDHQNICLEYSFRPLIRGDIYFNSCQINMRSPWLFWQINTKIFDAQHIKVYPNYKNLIKYTLLVTGNHLSMMGILQQRRRGLGQDFHQLREYQQGDNIKQVDWKATARMHKLITKDYQDERDQEILLLVDCGRRMLAQDGELSHFDHSLNALLLLAYVGLSQGDAVGVATFSGTKRWQIPRKGLNHLTKILNSVYDIQPGLAAPDYIYIALSIMRLQRKRTLVIILTNLRDEESPDLLTAIELISQRHLVLIASLQEPVLNDILTNNPTTLDHALQIAGAHEYMYQRRRTIAQLKSQGVQVLDTPANDLAINLVNQYFTVKTSGQW